MNIMGCPQGQNHMITVLEAIFHVDVVMKMMVMMMVTMISKRVLPGLALILSFMIF